MLSVTIMGLQILFILMLLAINCVDKVVSLSYSDLYHYSNAETDKLPPGDDKYEFIKLGTPILFYSETYDHIYINTNGILTFGVQFPNFVNLPFPLEYPAIAPFYTNVDTTNANESTTISYFKSHDANLLRIVSDAVILGFSDAYDFQALSVFVATWENVGYFSGKNDKQNTFQVAIICSEEETYVQFLYPQDKLNWIQADIGDSGLPDVRAQAGFVSEDGRYFVLKGSGTKNIVYLTENSNYGVPGSWIFRIGPLSYEDTIDEPDYLRPNEKELKNPTCESQGKLKCHSAATCTDTSYGYCCSCNDGYFGNGYSCLKNDIPIRVSGKLSGTIGNISISSQLQSYVVMVDGRSYTAISPLIAEIGYSLQLIQILGGVVGWLFAKPGGNVKNGYQITGGILNHTTYIRFEETNEEFRIMQKFQGLNVWDQLSVTIEVSGDLPKIPIGSSITVPDVTEEYQYNTATSIRSTGTRNMVLGNTEIMYNIDQEIDFLECEYAGQSDYHNQPTVYNRISRITSNYQPRENALRIGMLNKVMEDATSNQCTDGTALCGDNTICSPIGEDDYECNCKNGYAPHSISNGVQNCVDIDECSGYNVCDSNAHCHNELGGYSCTCKSGFTGNGYNCDPVEEGAGSSLTPEHWQCDQCSENAECFQGVCVCRNGWSGDGIECTYNCQPDMIWNLDRCVPISSDEEEELEVQPFCHQRGCSCPTGYELFEYLFGQSCRLTTDGETPVYNLEEDKLPCDVENNCSPNATCEWAEIELRNRCVCNPGFEGNGYECTEREVSCLYESICDLHASCAYDEVIGKSICKCDKGFEGDGRTCQAAPECHMSSDCGANTMCENGICICEQGFERDISEFCVPSGSCGGAYCAENAVCQWDNVQRIAYCHCPVGFIGDGLKNCKSIPPPCNVRNNCGLYASCSPNYRDPRVYECVCNVGYYGDGFVCTPEVNCINVPSLCAPNAQCVSTTTGFQCICNSGFIGNGSYCVSPPRYDSGFLLLSQGVATVRIPFDGKGSKPVAITSMAIGIDKDCSQGRLYWSDISSKQIVSSKYDGTDRQVFIGEDIISPEGVAVDWISRRLYWTDSTKDTIEVASLDNSSLRVVIIRKHLVNPRGIAVDPHQNKLYWSDWNRDEPKIEWSNLDGTERQILLSQPSVKLPNSLVILQTTGELCFADAGTGKVECIDTYSKAVRTIAANLSYPFGLTVTNDKFYWTDWTTKKIESVDHNGNHFPGIISPLFGSHKMYGMAAVTDNCPLFFSECQINNGECSNERLCLVNARSPSGRSCKCANSKTNCNEIIMDE